MLSANIEVCGHFCIQQLWGTKAKFSFMYESIEKFIDEIESVETKVGDNDVVAKQYKEIDAASPLIEKRCERMHALKSRLYYQILLMSWKNPTMVIANTHRSVNP